MGRCTCEPVPGFYDGGQEVHLRTFLCSKPAIPKTVFEEENAEIEKSHPSSLWDDMKRLHIMSSELKVDDLHKMQS